MSLNVVVVRHSTALETGDIVTSVRVLEPGECKYWRIATINMTGDIVRNVGPGTTETTAGQNIPCLCYDVLMLPPPRRSSPAQPFTFLSSKLCQIEYIFHQLSIFLSLSSGCMIIVGEPACATYTFSICGI